MGSRTSVGYIQTINSTAKESLNIGITDRKLEIKTKNSIALNQSVKVQGQMYYLKTKKL